MGLSTIQWCDFTHNQWAGCRKAMLTLANGKKELISECSNCYIPTTVPLRIRGMIHGPERIRFSDAYYKHPHRWNKLKVCRNCGGLVRIADQLCPSDDCGHYEFRRPRVFCMSLGDWLDDENVPIEWFADLLKLIHDTPNLDWLLLTKRPQNWFRRIEQVRVLIYKEARGHGTLWDWLDSWTRHAQPPANVWIGVSAGADQAAALDIPARVHFLSCEPMLRPLECTDGRCPDCGYTKADVANLMDHRLCRGPGPKGFDWIIFGGESGSKARMCNVDWIRDGVKFCRSHGVAPFVKQLGSTNGQVWGPMGAGHGLPFAIKDSHGGDMDEWPEDLRVRCFPEVKP